jgi:hypothetical protein
MEIAGLEASIPSDVTAKTVHLQEVSHALDKALAAAAELEARLVEPVETPPASTPGRKSTC